MPSRLLVTGGAGFIGSSFIRYVLSCACACERLINLDLLTYAADMRNLKPCECDPRYFFVKGDVCNTSLIEKICVEERIDTIVHFAAQTHVDKSIASPLIFFHMNVQGTLSLLEVVRKIPSIHFHHISTDEVYGALNNTGYFSETSPYRPNSPYAASKAASDHCVRSYAHTYGLSTTISHCSNNYGPCQHVEKFIPRVIASCLFNLPFPLYGTGENVRDWIFVDDHSEAVWMILERGKCGETYDISSRCEKTNKDMVHMLVDALASLTERDPQELRSLIAHVPDRPGHDFRYAIDASKIEREIGWMATRSLSDGLNQTLLWYLNNQERLTL